MNAVDQRLQTVSFKPVWSRSRITQPHGFAPTLQLAFCGQMARGEDAPSEWCRWRIRLFDSRFGRRLLCASMIRTRPLIQGHVYFDLRTPLESVPLDRVWVGLLWLGALDGPQVPVSLGRHAIDLNPDLAECESSVSDQYAFSDRLGIGKGQSPSTCLAG